MDITDYIDFKTAKILKDKGFSIYTDSMFVKKQCIKDDILNKYPGLSDDGYYDLLIKNGGIYKENEVYEYKLAHIDILCANTEYYFNNYPSMLCTRPTIYEVRNWLQEYHNIHIFVQPNLNNIGDQLYNIISYKLLNNEWIIIHENNNKYDSYKIALQNEINFIIEII